MKKIFGILLAVVLALSLSATAFADSFSGDSDWAVTFTSGGELSSNFSSSSIADAVADLQPGDDITFTVSLVNRYSESVDWYMINRILQSLEDESSASGGAYSYLLRYTAAGGESRELYNSDTVGGELEANDKSGEGLHEVDSAMKDYFYLDTMKTGQSGTVTLRVALDGESQGNRYQATKANLQLRFAVEEKTAAKSNIVMTGDETNLGPWYIAMAVSGTAFLLLALDGYRQRKARGGKNI